jgi:hypothetical protein
MMVDLTADELALINAALIREQHHLQELLSQASGLGEGLAGEVGKLTPIRDNGPYDSAEQAIKQFLAQTHGIPGTPDELSGVVLREALLLAKVDLGAFFELEYMSVFLKAAWGDPVMAQIIAGWIIRAHIAGRDKSF